MWWLLVLPSLVLAASEPRTSNSVEIQACVSGPLTSPARLQVQGAVLEALVSQLNSTSVYYESSYRSALSDLCYLFVYQAPSPVLARSAAAYLSNLGLVRSVGVQAQLLAVVWNGQGDGGVQLPFDWTASEVLLWGGCALGLLFSLLASICCYTLLRVRGSK